MGISSSKSTSKTTYGKDALPKINAATDAITGAYQGVRPDLAKVTAGLGASFDAFNPNKPNITAANGYVGDVLGGKYLQGNPYIDRMIADTGDSVADRINALFGRNGQTGSTRQIGELGKQLASAENNLRYQDYSSERDRMAQATSAAAGLSEAENNNLQTQAALGQSLVGIPLDVANQYASGIQGLWGNNLNTKTKTGMNLGAMLIGGAANAASAWAGGGFK
ncbi:hypothetical protein [Sphingobium sp. EP60837]|uniref:hypothetical protein n=1 Tax=Sphingobium sp. EP60837 TaxID=1855519 RepID=UPI0007DCE2AD|nr:hypothetical protein [Sphingobium sp. EP60837]ANI79006.1 hypothetical protein EP837_02611 [Sphingobium sp. EP60837]